MLDFFYIGVHTSLKVSEHGDGVLLTLKDDLTLHEVTTQLDCVGGLRALGRHLYAHADSLEEKRASRT